MWIRDIKMGKHALPVYSVLLYRLQHNALFFGYRLQHFHEAQRLCHHGCGVLETAPHLLWYCDFAVHVWNDWLPTFHRFFTSPLEWESLLWFKITPTPSAKTQYGYSLFGILHIVRAVVMRCLWMHRDDIHFHDLFANLIDGQGRIKAVISLHVERYYQDLLLKTRRHSGCQRRHLQRLVTTLGISAIIPPPAGTDEPQLEYCGE
ncbi:hypothetical protein GN244_ATG13141 [Phytophthora infestans]|uniref:Reverse transcriptase zinc-binding domain-containing protein n=1 Tax=Phytophthora infestans TaxID=4787 RepID=A0A833SYE0_PHYIN|nr:hypothetical protein GN244_ATG13141 [Phytophthora infestans]